MRVLLLENPSAGSPRRRRLLASLASALERKGETVRVFRGEQPGDIARHVRTLRPGDADLVVLAGGDGTLRAVVNAAPRPVPWPLALLPVGTANLVARETALWGRLSPDRLAVRLLRSRPWPVDAMEIERPDAETECAVAVVSAGLDAAIVRAVMDARAARGGAGGYAVWLGPSFSTLRTFPHEPLEVRVDDGPAFSAATVIVQNARVYAGLFRLAPQAGLDSGALDAVLLPRLPVRDLLGLAVRATLGRAHRDRRVRVLRGRSVSITAGTPVPVQVDGDPGGTTDVTVRVSPHALQLLRLSPLRGS